MHFWKPPEVTCKKRLNPFRQLHINYSKKHLTPNQKQKCLNIETFNDAVLVHTNMQFQFEVLDRGRNFAVHEGHSKTSNKTTINSIQRRCKNYYQLRRPAILKIGKKLSVIRELLKNKTAGNENKPKDVVKQIK